LYCRLPTAGGGPDASVLAIAHAERRGTEAPRVTLDLCRGWHTRNVEGVVAEMASLLRRYRVGQVVGDKYAGEWVPAAFQRHGIHYHHAAQTRSEVYLALHPLLATERVALLDHPTLLKELRQLERRTSRMGRDVVDHPPRLHDDFANAAALAIVTAERRATEAAPNFRTVFGPLHRRPVSPLVRFLDAD
jgi:hypothetical protein